MPDCEVAENEDVVGPKFSNLIQETVGTYSVFRIDNGGVLDFNPAGSTRDFDKSPSMVDMIKNMKYGKRKDTNTEVSNCSEFQTHKRKAYADPTESAHLCRVACYETVNDRTVEKQIEQLRKSDFFNEIEKTRFQGNEMISCLIYPQFANYLNILKARLQEVLDLRENGDLGQIFRRQTRNPRPPEIQIQRPMFQPLLDFDDSDDFESTTPPKKRLKPN